MEASISKDKISKGQFIAELWKIKEKTFPKPASALSKEELLHYAHFRGWIEDDDERHPDVALNRQTAARIAHQFLRIECNLPDIEDITPATILKDLYNCRVCANHIAQIYLRGIMNAMNYQAENQTVQIFNHLETVSQHEAEEIMTNISKCIKTTNILF